MLTVLKNKKDSHTVRNGATEALGNIKHEKISTAIPTLIKLLKGGGEVDGSYAELALEKISSNLLKKNPNPTIKDPHYIFSLNIKLRQHPETFTKIYEDLQKKRYKNNSTEWWLTHTQKLKAMEKSAKLT